MSISVSEQVADLRDDFTRLLFTWMIPHADDYGVLPGAPRRVRALVVPLIDCTTEQVEAALADIEARELIWRYTDSEGRPWIQFRKWEEHQQGLHKRTKPKCPLYSEVMGYTKESAGSSRKFPEVPSEQKRREGNRTEENIRSVSHVDDASGDESSQVMAHAITALTPLGESPAQTRKPKTARPRDPLWDVMVEVFEYQPETPPERNRWNAAHKFLRDAGATPEQVRIRAARLIEKYEHKRLTPPSLVSHWGEMANPVPVSPSSSSNGQRNTSRPEPTRPDASHYTLTLSAKPAAS